jgi:hypothetical protein
MHDLVIAIMLREGRPGQQQQQQQEGATLQVFEIGHPLSRELHHPATRRHDVSDRQDTYQEHSLRSRIEALR